MTQLLSLTLLLFATAQVDDTKAIEKTLTGIWEAVRGSETVPLSSTLEFTKDGKVKLVLKDGDDKKEIQGSYKMDGPSALKLTLEIDGQKHSERIKIEKLAEKELVIVDEQNKKDVFKRRK
jgi:uncharacterized protein (TIGR03066 family)